MAVNGACVGDVRCLQYKRVFTISEVTITRVHCIKYSESLLSSYDCVCVSAEVVHVPVHLSWDQTTSKAPQQPWKRERRSTAVQRRMRTSLTPSHPSQNCRLLVVSLLHLNIILTDLEHALVYQPHPLSPAHAQFTNVEKMADKAAKKVHLQGASPPVFHSLKEFSQGSEHNELRYYRLVAKFEEWHGRKPDFLARAPGRVNIVGEHVDYSGYAVLPMAIEQDVAIACSLNDERVLRLSNCSERFAATRTVVPLAGGSPAIEGNAWFNYFFCGYKGIVDDLGVEDPVGMNVVVSGNVPPSAGLSSSSALVCSAALVTAYANGLEMPSKQELAELCAKCERYIGTEGGGMDQAISFLGEKGKAMLIEFNPIRPTHVHLPSNTVFVISNSRVQANKSAFASFNKRVTECRLASMVVAKAKDLDWKTTQKLLQLQTALGLQLGQMTEVVSSCLHKEPYSRSEVCSTLGISESELESEYLSNMTKNVQSFELYNRACHVFGEAERVYKFKDIANQSCDTADANTDTADTNTDTANASETNTDTVDATNDTNRATTDTVNAAEMAIKLGQLMDESHTSCSQLYECSCSELDMLVRLCKSSRALGSRLTGAGWGGCAVSLVWSRDCESFMRRVGEGYYKEKDGEPLSHYLFATSPGPGAALSDFRH